MMKRVRLSQDAWCRLGWLAGINAIIHIPCTQGSALVCVGSVVMAPRGSVDYASQGSVMPVVHPTQPPLNPSGPPTCRLPLINVP